MCGNGAKSACAFAALRSGAASWCLVTGLAGLTHHWHRVASIAIHIDVSDHREVHQRLACTTEARRQKILQASCACRVTRLADRPLGRPEHAEGMPRVCNMPQSKAHLVSQTEVSSGKWPQVGRRRQPQDTPPLQPHPAERASTFCTTLCVVLCAGWALPRRRERVSTLQRRAIAHLCHCVNNCVI